jgi:DNA-binding MurR/RpiR family transcriptional regulator
MSEPSAWIAASVSPRSYSLRTSLTRSASERAVQNNCRTIHITNQKISEIALPIVIPAAGEMSRGRTGRSVAAAAPIT